MFKFRISDPASTMSDWLQSLVFGGRRLQIDLARSSSGVGWANGYCHILTFARTSRLAGFWARGKPLDTISRGSAVFFPVLKHRDIPPLRSPLKSYAPQNPPTSSSSGELIQELDFIRYFFGDPVDVHTLGEKYPENLRKRLNSSKRKNSFFVT